MIQAAVATETELVTAADADAEVGSVIPQVESIRGLSFRDVVPVDVIDDAAARRYVLERADRLELQDQIATAQTAYRLLGLIEADDDMIELFLAALEEQAGGFYDPGRKRFYLLDDMPKEMIGVLTAHELTHALEDQHYDLEKRIDESKNDDDAAFAQSCLHEGSATLVMTVYAARAILNGTLDGEVLGAFEEEVGGGEALAELPPVLLRQMVGPYVLGAGFLARGNMLRIVQQGYPVDDVNRLFDDPPRSSEQILHPEKYWDERDDPVRVRLGRAGKKLGRGFRRAGGGTLGELAIAVMVGAETTMDPAILTAQGSSAWTNEAASGWGGDAWELWQRGETSVVLLSTVWDSEADAAEFAEAIGRAPAPDGGRLVAHRDGDRVAVVSSQIADKRAIKIDRAVAAMLGVRLERPSGSR